ncbi:MAG TPA: metallophosphoesterase [Pirellulales bacterium]
MMPTNLPARRGFLTQSLAAAALAAGRSWALAAPAHAEPWACPVLGDLHFDRLEHHDLAWLEKDHPGDVRQVQNYSRVTREVMPRLMAVVKKQIERQTGEAGTAVPLVLQLGDLLEGLCGTPDLAARQAREAIDFVREADFGRPLLMVKGNHDVTGPGAAEIYNRLLVPFMSHESLDEIRQAVFTQRRGGTLLVFYDAYDKASLDWFANIVEERRPERLVFLIHPPVVPYNARSSWHIYSKPSQESQRRRLLELLGSVNAIVLCGHLHKYSLLRRRTEHGSFTQLAISSVATDLEAKPRDELSGLDEYGPDLVRLEPNHSPNTIAERRALLAAEKPFIEHFEYADTWGHAMLRFDGGSVTTEVFRGLSTSVWKKHRLA